MQQEIIKNPKCIWDRTYKPRPLRDYDGNHPNIFWPLLLTRIKSPRFPRIQSTVDPKQKGGYEL